MKRASIAITIALLGLAALALPQFARAGERERCFPETGFCARGAILDYWERNGGLPVFGYPIGPEIPNEVVEGSWVGTTQWFERDRLELHASGVMAGRLGARVLELQGRSWWDFPPFVGATPQGCAYFNETRHSLCEPFLSYWRQNGGLERFGYPLSEPMREQIGGWNGTVQYFERRRMEHHAELRGTKYEVLLGLLGHEVSALQPPVLCSTPIVEELRASLEADPALRENLGCPAEAARDAPASSQPFDHGTMVWTDLGASGKKIFAIYKSPYAPGNPLTYGAFDDTWSTKYPVDYGLTPPAGHVAPLRGFGLLWISNKFVREGMGWPTAAEQPGRAGVQRFGSGATVLWIKGAATVFVLKTQSQVSVLSYRT